MRKKCFHAFFWLSPAFERLRHPLLRKAMSGRVTVSQAARVAQIPLTEALYVLNLAAGEDSKPNRQMNLNICLNLISNITKLIRPANREKFQAFRIMMKF